MKTTLNQARARRYARNAFAAFLVVGAASLGAAIWGARPRPAPAVEPLRTTTVAIQAVKDERPRGSLVDAHGMAVRFSQIANPPVPGEKPVYPDEGPSPPPPESGDQTVRYLGQLVEPTRTLALLKIGDRQRLVGAGDSMPIGADQTGSIRIIEVRPDSVVVEEAGTQRVIEKTARQGPSVTYLSGTAPPVRPGANPGPDPTGRVRGLGRPNEPPVVPPPGARIIPGDRQRQNEAGGERQ